MKSKGFFSRNKNNGIFSVLYFSEVWDMEKKNVSYVVESNSPVLFQR